MRLAYTCVENVAFRCGSSVDASGAGARKTPPRLPSAAGGFGGAGAWPSASTAATSSAQALSTTPDARITPGAARSP